MDAVMVRSLSALIIVALASGCAGTRLDTSPLPAAPRAPLTDVGAVDADAPSGAPNDPSRSSKTVVLSGTPEIPAALRARLGQYLNTRAASLEHLADDGKSVVITTRFAQTSQAHVVTSPMGVRTQLTFDDEPVRNVSTSRDGQALLYMSDTGGNEQYQIRRLDRRTGKVTRLTDGKSRHGGYVWSHAGDRIAYTSNARNGKDMDLYLGDGRAASAGSLLLERSGHWYPIEFSRDGQKLLVGQYVSINDMRLHLVDIKTKTPSRLTPEAPAASYRAATLHPDGKRAFIATDREGEHAQLFELSLQGERKWKPLSKNLPWNVSEVALSTDGRTLAFVSNEEGYGVLRLLDTASGRIRPVRGIPKGIVGSIRFARNKNVLGFSLAGATEAGDAFTLDVVTGRITRFTKSEVGGMDAATFRAPKLIRYETFDKKKIPAYVYLPSGTGPHPVLVWIHGGPESQARPWFSPLIQYLVVEKKVAVLVPNVRGSDGYGKSYLLLDNGEKREGSVRDIGSLLDWAKAQSNLDASRVAVLGGSYGGYMVLASLVRYAERLVAGVDIVGISNFVTFLKNTKEYRRDLRRAEYGDERKPKMREFLTKISPSENAHRIKSALFVAHGANDPRVPLSETDQIVAAVRKNDRDVWYMVANNEGHGFRKKENRDLFYLLTVLFLEKHLKPAQ